MSDNHNHNNAEHGKQKHSDKQHKQSENGEFSSENQSSEPNKVDAEKVEQEQDSDTQTQSAQSPESTQQSKIEELEHQLKAKSEEAEKFKREYGYLMAEFDNYKKRVAGEKLSLIETASKDVIKDLLAVVDDFERALSALDSSEDSSSAKEGAHLIYKKLLGVLKAKGVSEIEAVGKELDTDEHEAVAQLPTEDEALKGKIIEDAQKGYKLNGSVIRYAKVVIGI